MVKGRSPAALDRITITNQDNITEDITTSHEMTRAIIDINIEHFHQAAETPFAQPFLNELVPPLLPSHNIDEKILTGDISDFMDQDAIIQDILKSLEKLPTTTES